MKENKGFTLIELLAVIVILAVIALIVTPIIMNVINDAKKGSIKDSAYGYAKAIELAVSRINLKNIELVGDFTINETGNLVKNNEEIKLEVKGTTPTNGIATISKSGAVGFTMKLNGNCIVKKINSDEIQILPTGLDCTKEYHTNLITNGYLEYGDNRNFENFTYEQSGFLKSPTTSEKRIYTTDDFIPVDTNKTYLQSIDMKSSNTNAIYYIGLAEYDIDRKAIAPYFVTYIDNTLTTLTKDLKDGDTVVYLKDTSKFLNESTTLSYRLGFIFWNYQDSTGKIWPELTYSRNVWMELYLYTGIDKTNNTITLKKPWDKGTIKAGTKLSQSNSGSTYNYGVMRNKSITEESKTYTNTISGVGHYEDFHKFRYGTKYVKILLWENANNQPSTTTYYRNFIFREI